MDRDRWWSSFTFRVKCWIQFSMCLQCWLRDILCREQIPVSWRLATFVSEQAPHKPYNIARMIYYMYEKLTTSPVATAHSSICTKPHSVQDIPHYMHTYSILGLKSSMMFTEMNLTDSITKSSLTHLTLNLFALHILRVLKAWAKHRMSNSN